MSLRRMETEGDLDPAYYGNHSSQGLLARLINKLLFRNGSQSLINRLLRGQLEGRDSKTRRIEHSSSNHRAGSSRRPQIISPEAMLAEAPPLDSATPSLLSGFNAFLEGEHRKESRRDSTDSQTGGTGQRQRRSLHTHLRQDGDDRRSSIVSYVDEGTAPLELAADDFYAMLESTPDDMVHEVLVERRGEYSDYLRRLEKARKQLVQRLREIDDRIMEAISDRKEIDGRIAAVDQERKQREIEESDVAVDEVEGRGCLARKSSDGLLSPSDSKQRAKTTVEDVSDDGSDVDQGGDGAVYEQDDVPRLRRLRQLFKGHYAAITSIDYDPIQGLVASGSLDTQVRVWDSDTGECKYTISGHGDVIRGVQFYDRFLISASNDSRIRMWDLSMFDSVQPQPSTRILREEYVALSQEHGMLNSDGDLDLDADAAAAASNDDEDNMMFPRRSAGSSGDLVKPGAGGAHPHPRQPRTIMTLQSTTPLVSPTICRHVPPLELCCENTFIGHTDAVTCFQASEGTLISGSADKTVREWDLSTGSLRQAINVTWAAKESQSVRLANRGAGSPALLPWASPRTLGRSTMTPRQPVPFAPMAAGGSKRGTDDGDAGFIGALQFYEFALATGTADGALRLWDLRTAQAHRQFFGHTQPITSLQFDDQSVLTGSLDGTSLLWDLRSGRVLQTLTFGSPVTDVQLVLGNSSHGSYSAECWIAARDSKLHHYQSNSMQHDGFASDFGLMDTHHSRSQTRAISSGNAAVTRVRRQGANSLLSGDADGIIKIWGI